MTLSPPCTIIGMCTVANERVAIRMAQEPRHGGNYMTEVKKVTRAVYITEMGEVTVVDGRAELTGPGPLFEGALGHGATEMGAINDLRRRFTFHRRRQFATRVLSVHVPA